jgi:hypothetical protein
MASREWHRAQIVFRADDATVERLMAAISGQDLVEIGSLEIARCEELVPVDEPQATGLHGPRVLGD